MTNKEAIEQLRFDQDMIRFDGNTGDFLTLEEVKNRNELNYKTYLADESAIEALEEQEKYRWIPLSERLPEEYEKVLACTDMECRYVGFLNGKGKWNCIAELVNTEIDYSKVIAWMPLPEPYKEK